MNLGESGMDFTPCRILLRDQSLTTEFLIYAIVNFVQPFSEGCRCLHNLQCKRLEFHIIRKRGPTVLAWQDIWEQAEPGKNVLFVLFAGEWLCRN